MTSQAVSEGVFSIMRSKMPAAKAASLTPASLVAELGIASLDMVDVLFEVENAFGIEIVTGEFDVASDTRAQELVDYVEARIAAKNGAG